MQWTAWSWLSPTTTYAQQSAGAAIGKTSRPEGGTNAISWRPRPAAVNAAFIAISIATNRLACSSPRTHEPKPRNSPVALSCTSTDEYCASMKTEGANDMPTAGGQCGSYCISGVLLDYERDGPPSDICASCAFLSTCRPWRSRTCGRGEDMQRRMSL